MNTSDKFEKHFSSHSLKVSSAVNLENCKALGTS